MSQPKCPCGRPLVGATLCGRCRKTLDVALANVLGYAADLETVVRTKRSRFGPGAVSKGTKGKAQPLPIDMRFADRDSAGTMLAHDVRARLVAWVREILELHRPVPGPTCPVCLHVSCSIRRRTRVPADTIANMVGYLLGWTAELAATDDGPLMLREMLDLEVRLRTFVDRPLDRVYAGMCSVCRVTGDRVALYARVGDVKVACPECAAEYDVADRREDMRASLDSMILTAAEISQLATYLDLLDDRDRVRNRINQWHVRQRIAASSVNSSGDPQFVFGEVVRMLVADDSDRRWVG